MKLAFLYAGQGSQKVGMGKDFYDRFESVRTLFDSVPLSFDWKQIMFHGPEEQLAKTQYTQPCMVAFAAAVTDLFRQQGVVPEVAAGLSLGEYSALYAAGAFDAKTAIELVAYRGNVMAETTKGMDCKMVAVLGLDEGQVRQALQGVSGGMVGIANFNCPGQIVIGGECTAVDQAVHHATQLGAKRCIPLNVSGPFHTTLMQQASDLLRKRLTDTDISPLAFPVISNVTGQAMGVDVKGALVEQIKNPVRFEQSIATMAQMGVDTIVEIGPGKVLSGFVKKTANHIRLLSVERVEDYWHAVEALSRPVEKEEA